MNYGNRIVGAPRQPAPGRKEKQWKAFSNLDSPLVLTLCTWEGAKVPFEERKRCVWVFEFAERRGWRWRRFFAFVSGGSALKASTRRTTHAPWPRPRATRFTDIHSYAPSRARTHVRRRRSPALWFPQIDRKETQIETGQYQRLRSPKKRDPRLAAAPRPARLPPLFLAAQDVCDDKQNGTKWD